MAIKRCLTRADEHLGVLGGGSRTAGLGAADPVFIFSDDLVTALPGHVDKIAALRLGMLVEARDPEIERGAFHLRRPCEEFLAM